MSEEGNSGCICIVDDDAELRGALSSLFRSHGYSVALYDAPDDFLAAGLPAVASCLLLDIRLRGENGLDFQERLLDGGIAIPVILMTGHGDIPMTVRGMRAGALDFLPKPFDDQQVLDAARRALEVDQEQRLSSAAKDVLKGRYGSLTSREREVMSLVTAGLMNKQVAYQLEVSEITVKIHRGKVMRKMEAQSLADLVRMAEELGVRDESAHRFNA